MRPVPIDNPPNPWASTEVEYLDAPPPSIRLQVYEDHTKEILSHNDSPDLGFRYSVNPYRGCMHACAYCYARPSHEYLSFGAGTDFDTRIVVKPDAPALLRAAFDRRAWKGELVVFSGVTDCYQPLEASLRLTRGCLQVCAEYQNPVGLITKAPLVERDIDLLQELTRRARAHVTLSVPFWDQESARAIEPYAATPRRRLQAIERLAAAGISVGVNVAPIIPGLNDQDLPNVLKAAADAGATSAGFVLVRLPGPVKEVFEARVRAAMPLRAERILHRIRETRYAEMIGELFKASCQKAGLEVFDMRPGGAEEPGTTFRRPVRPSAQLGLFE